MLLRTFAIVVAVALPTTALADCCMQFVPDQTMFAMTMTDTAIGNRTTEMMNDQVRSRSGSTARSARSRTGISSRTASVTTPSKPTSIAHLNYAQNAQLSNDIKNKVIASILQFARKKGRLKPETEAEVRSKLGEINIVRQFTPEIAKHNLNPNNPATAVTTFLAVGFAILQDRDSLTDAQIRGINRQMATAMAATTRTSDADMQRFSENLYWTALVNLFDWNNTRNGMPGFTSATLKQSVSQTMRQIGFDPADWRVGPTGLVSNS